MVSSPLVVSARSTICQLAVFDKVASIPYWRFDFIGYRGGLRSPFRDNVMTNSDASIESIEDPPRVYDSAFFLCYVSNIFTMIAISLLFRYPDFIRLATVNKSTYEFTLGMIVGVGAVGAVLFRIVQGRAIDRMGAGWIWLLSVAGMATSLYWHSHIRSVDGWEVNLARLLFTTSVAGIFGAWISFVSLRVPHHRVAEAVGVVGSSGFLGMALGPTLGDFIFTGSEVTWPQVVRMFHIATFAAGLAWITGILAVAQGGRIDRRREPAAAEQPRRPIQRLQVIKLLLVGAILGLVVSFPGNFLRPYTATLNLDRMMLFFWTYNFVAFATRIIFRRAAERIGIENMIKIGLAAFAASMLSYITVRGQLSLMLPAIVGGVGHAFLFPAVVASVTSLFPASKRGRATNMTLASYDIGVLVGAPFVGWILTQSRQSRIPEYPVMFACLALLVASTLVFYSWPIRKPPSTD